MNQQQTSFPGGYRSRYLAYVNQPPPAPAHKPTQWSRLSRGLLSFVIFVALFLAILTLFGLWLSRAGRSAASTEVNTPPAVVRSVTAPSPTPAASKRRNARAQ